jgi:hypothetical protein
MRRKALRFSALRLHLQRNDIVAAIDLLMQGF